MLGSDTYCNAVEVVSYAHHPAGSQCGRMPNTLLAWSSNQAGGPTTAVTQGWPHSGHGYGGMTVHDTGPHTLTPHPNACVAAGHGRPWCASTLAGSMTPHTTPPRGSDPFGGVVERNGA
jgi:hypothetical protein